MNKSTLTLIASVAVASATLSRPAMSAQAEPGATLNQFGTRPTAANDTSLRPLSPEEIPPNLNFYAVNPLFKEGASLGWATERIEEKINRGTVALVGVDKKVYLSWRLLKTDAQNVAFNIYRSTAGAAATKLNAQPIALTTDYIDASAPLDRENTWSVRPVVNGREVEEPMSVTHAANSPAQNYRAIKLKEDVTSISMTAIGDLNGDGTYDFVVKWPGGGKDPGSIRVSQGSYKFDAYDGKTGQFLWRHDLGWNVDMGVWWTPFVVRDLDGDNKAEVCFRTKPYAATLAEASEGARKGNALEGPEWLAVHDGSTGKLIDQVDWIELGTVQDWGDNTGNRASRHLMGVAYLDGKTPAVLVVRGTYGVMKIDAWTLENKKLKKIWRWTNERAPFNFQGQGAHGLQIGDVDGDGKDEIFNGAIGISHDGRSLWSTGLGHGDRMYLTDIDPSRPGLEIAYICEDAQPQLGVNIRNPLNGDLIWGARDPNLDNAIDQVAVGDIDPKYPGMEVWINKGLNHLYYSAKGEPIPGPVPSTSELVWWDGDLLREQLGGGGGGGGGGTRGGRGRGGPEAAGAGAGAAGGGAVAAAQAVPAAPAAFGGRFVGKWENGALAPVTSGIVGGVQQIADISGDWREEIVTFSNGELRIYSTTIPAKDRRVSLMQDSIYRHTVTTRTMGYTHAPQVSYYLGEKMKSRRRISSVRFSGLFFAMFGLLFAQAGRAHDPFSSWTDVHVGDDHIRFELTMSRSSALLLLVDGNKLPPITPQNFGDYAPRLKAVASELFEITADGKPLGIQSFDAKIAGEDDVAFHLRFPRPEKGPLRLLGRYLDYLVDGHVGTVSVKTDADVILGWAPISIDEPVFVVPLPARGSVENPVPVRPSFAQFLKLGIHHILIGYDHLLFLIGLIIACRRFKTMAGIITCFTLAHSITLALAAFDVVSLSPRVVEPLIAASIVFVGVENLLRGGRESRGRWLLAFAFGLVHGFGFAGALKEVGAGLAGRALAVPLFSFNLGVEIGQIAVAAVCLPVLFVLLKQEKFKLYGPPVISSFVALAGGWWLVQRTFFS